MYSFFNLGDGWGVWSTPHPGRFTPRQETRYPFYRGLGGPHGKFVGPMAGLDFIEKFRVNRNSIAGPSSP